jgi:uncharacterized cupredoxin-like copper-binding protein
LKRREEEVKAMKNTRILKLLATGLLILAATVFLAACSSSADEDRGQADQAAAHVDDVDANGDAGDVTDADDHDAEADAAHDDDADEHSDADGDHDADGGGDHDAVEIVVSMTDGLTFEPSQIEVEAGQAVRLTIENAGLALHDFTIGEMAVHVGDHEGDSDDLSHMDGEEHDNALHMALDGGTTGTIEFTPEEAGEYEFHCTVLGHTEGGMIGTLIVAEA